MAPHGKELSEDLKKLIVALHKDGIGYKKIAKTLKLSCSTVAKTIQRFNRTGSTQNRPRHGWPKKLSARAQRHIQKLCLGNGRMSAASIAAEVEGVGGQPVSAQTIRRTLHQIGLHGCRPRRKPLLKMMHKKAHKQFAKDKQTKDMDYWNHVLWSDEINLFGSDGVKHVWRQPSEEYKDKCVLPTVKHGGGSVMVWGCMSAAGTGELQFIEGTMNANMYCDILKQSMIPSLRRLGRRAVFQHNDPQIYTVIQAEHSLLYIVAKCNYFSVVTWKDTIKYLQKCEGCTHFCEILYMWNWITKPVRSCTGLFVAIANNTLYGSKL